MRYMGCLFAVLLVLIGQLRVAAQDVAGLPTVSLKHTDKPPEIDGALDDTCWASCEPLEFVRFPHGEPPSRATRARLCTDGTWLFVAYTCRDPALLPRERVLHRTDTPVTATDCVELYLDPGTGGKQYFHFAADRFGQQYEKRGTLNPWTGTFDKDADWNTHWRAAGATTKAGWSAELAIPLCTLKQAAGEEAWRINVCRTEQDMEKNIREWSQWARTQGTFHDPARFGVLGKVPGKGEEPPFLPVLEGVRMGILSDAQGLNEYPVLIAMRNDSSKSGEVRVVIDDNAPGGKRKQVEKKFVLGANEKHVFKVPMQQAGMVGVVEPDPVVTVSTADGLGQWATSMTYLMGRLPSEEDGPLDAYLDRSFYTHEAEAGLRYAVKLPAAQLASLTLKAEAVEQDKAVVDVRVNGLEPGDRLLALPLKDLAHGRYDVTVSLLSASGKTMAESTLSLVKRPPLSSGNEVKIDRYHRCFLVNGEPFFPYGVCWLKGDVKTLAELGFNCLIRWGGGMDYERWTEQGKTAAEIVAEDPLLNDCAAHGVMIIERPIKSLCGHRHYSVCRRHYSRTPGRPFPEMDRWFEIWQEMVPAVSTHPALLAFMNFDEPSDDFVGDKPRSRLSREMAGTLRALDGYHPVFNNANVPKDRRWRDHVDLVSTYHYWHAARSDMGRAVSGRALSAAKHAAMWHMPFLSMPSSGENMSVPLVHEERRASVFLRLIAGARGIYYFTWPANHVASRASQKEVGRQIHTLAPALLRRRPAQHLMSPDLAPEQRAVDASLLTFPDGRLLFLCANKTSAPVDASWWFDWLPDGTVFRGMFARDRKQVLHEKSFTERLDPLAVRAYLVEGGELPGDRSKPVPIVLRESYPDATSAVSVVADFGGAKDEAWRVKEPHEAFVAVGDEQAHSEAGHSIRLTRGEGDPAIIRAHSKPFALEKGHRYRLEGWVRTLFTAIPEEHSNRGAVLQVLMSSDDGYRPFPYICGSVKESTREWTRVVRDRQFVMPVDGTGMIRLQLWRVHGSAWFDDIRIIDLGLEDLPNLATKNLVPNSGFEIARLAGWPDRWRVTDYGDLSRGLLGTPTCPWGRDTEQVFQGAASLRMTGKLAHSTFSWYQRLNAGIRLKSNRNYVLSAYMKANRPGVRMTMWLRDIDEKTVALTTDWQRYELAGFFEEKALNNSTTAIRFNFPRGSTSEDVVWIDAVQLEQGTEPTAYVKDSYKGPSSVRGRK